ncbi:hypothetical protein GR268_37665 [Rhizobium leguminosarum]|uniref:hypothetical protein n=1 Tax=Rhizobium leguminosarum TaxID=384 RepID=UPI0013F6B7D5|nr:hypothetical protein [Rhizobium leguminosarum]NEJ82292.1 hypothetical protein [Rhizobium leguminosarum]NKK78027.1 hypothetical protein [Rhizobium leguminosarum bv. viciae]
MYNAKVIKELVDALGPLMEELDLYHTVERMGLHDRVIFWRRGDGDWRSTVEVMLRVQSETGLREMDWEYVEVGACYIIRNPLRNSGWYYDAPIYPTQGVVLGGKQEVLAAVERLLLTEPFFATGEGQPNIPDSGALLSLWHEIEYLLPADAAVAVDRDGAGNETLSFVYDDQSFEVIFSSDYQAGVELRIDGAHCDRSGSGTIEVADMMKRHVDGFGYKRW